ncbi:MAG: RNA methyltransferase [Patescibacteria group bacterium]
MRLVVVCDNLRSRFNVGAIFRTSDGAGVEKMYLCGITPAPPHSRIAKVALGAEQSVPWEKCANSLPLLRRLKREGFSIIALEQTKKSVPYYRLKTKNPPHQCIGAGVKPIALVVGTETTGFRPSILRASDRTIEIPMLGKKESLNVAVAFGIAAYHLRFSAHPAPSPKQ